MGEDEDSVQDMSLGLRGTWARCHSAGLVVCPWILSCPEVPAFPPTTFMISRISKVLWSLKSSLCTLSLGCSPETKAPWKLRWSGRSSSHRGRRKKGKTVSGHVVLCTYRAEDLSFDPQWGDGYREGNKLVCVSSFTHLISSIYSYWAVMTETWNIAPTLSSRRMCEGSSLIKRFLFVEPGSQCVDHTYLKLSILLTPTSKCWDYRHMTLCPALQRFLIQNMCTRHASNPCRDNAKLSYYWPHNFFTAGHPPCLGPFPFSSSCTMC